MQKLSFRYGAKTRTLNLPIERPKKIFVEFSDGEEIPVRKIYNVEGRAQCIKVLVDDCTFTKAKNEIADLKHDLEVSQKETAEVEGNVRSEIEKLNDELDSAENALQDFELRTGFKTSARSLNARILELADHVVELQERFY
jgi:hypothetical protein